MVSIDGEIDHHSAAQYRRLIDNEFLKTKAVNIIFDFSKLNFMDSSGIGLILGRAALCGEIGGRLNVRGLSRTLMKLVRLSGIEKIKNLHIQD